MALRRGRFPSRRLTAYTGYAKDSTNYPQHNAVEGLIDHPKCGGCPGCEAAFVRAWGQDGHHAGINRTRA